MAELEGPHLTQHIPETGMELEFVGALSALCRVAERERRFRMLSSGQLGGLAGAGSTVTAMNHTPKSRESSNQGG